MSNQVNLDELRPITTNYRRGSGEFDLRYLADSGENGYFEVSEQIYTEWNMDENGFTMYVDPDSKVACLAVLPIEEAVSYKGEARKFTSSEIIDKLIEYEIISSTEDAYLFLTHVGEREGIPYYQISTQSDTQDLPVVEGGVESEVGETVPDQSDEEITEQLDRELSV